MLMTTLRHCVVLLAGLAIAPQAAPQSVVPVSETSFHVPAFSNEYVTVLNVLIPPAGISGYHSHTSDGIGVLIGDTVITAQLLGEPASPSDARASGDVRYYSYPETMVHTVSASGDLPFHNIFVALRSATPGGFRPGSRDGVRGYTQLIDNERARVWRLVLEPGEEAAAITQSAPGIRIVVDGGQIVERLPDRADRAMAPRSGDFFWQEASVTRAIENTGASRIELVEVELK